MRWYRRHWYEVGLPIALGAIVAASVVDMQTLRRIVLFNFAVLLIHQFEEYRFPGGEPAIMNKVIQPSDIPDRYPLNQNNALVLNVFAAYPFYLLPVLFPGQAWLALAPVLFGFGQFFFHGVYTNLKLRGVYNPGLAAVVLGHVPVGIWYIVEGYSEHTISGWDWLIGVPYTAAFAVVTLKQLTYVWLADRNSPYPFDAEEMARFNVDRRLARLRPNALA
jgi:predicted outer membrane lipoprotein